MSAFESFEEAAGLAQKEDKGGEADFFDLAREAAPEKRPEVVIGQARDFLEVPKGGKKQRPLDFAQTYTSPSGEVRNFPAGTYTDLDWSAEHPVMGFLASLTLTPQGAASYLNEKLGKGSAFVGDDGEVYILTAEEKKKPPNKQIPQVFNKPGVSLGDVTLAAGPLLTGLGALFGTEIAAGAGGGLLVQSLAAGAGGVAGAGVKQALGAALPGEEEATAGQRALDLALSGGGEALAPGIGKLAEKGINTVLAPLVGKALTKPYREGLRLEADIGVRLNEAQLAQTKTLIARSRRVSQQVGGGPLREQQEAARAGIADFADALATRLDAVKEGSGDVATAAVDVYKRDLRTLGRMADAMVSANRESAAVGLSGAFKGHLKRLIEQRRIVANELFGNARELGGGKPVIDQTPLVDAFGEIIIEFQSRHANSQARAAIPKLIELRRQLLSAEEASRIPAGFIRQPAPIRQPSIPKLTINELQARLQDWGRAADLDEKVVEGLEDASLQSLVAGKISKAYRAMLDAAVESGDEIGGALAKARQSYREMSAPINVMRDNPLALLTKEPEKIVSKLVSKDSSQAQRAILKAADDINQVHGDEIRAAALGDIFGGVEDAVAGVMKPDKLVARIDKFSHQISVITEGKPKLSKAVKELRSKALEASRNPLEPFLQNPDRLVDLAGDATKARQIEGIMAYLRKASPERADALGAAMVNKVLRSAQPPASAPITERFNPAVYWNTYKRARGSIKAAVGGDHDIVRNLDSLADASRRIASTSVEGSRTQSDLVAEGLIRAVGRQFAGRIGLGTATGAGVGAYEGNGDLSAIGAGAASGAILGVLWNRALAYSMKNQNLGRGIAKLADAVAGPEVYELNPKARTALQMAIGDLLTIARHDPDVQEDLKTRVSPLLQRLGSAPQQGR